MGFTESEVKGSDIKEKLISRIETRFSEKRRVHTYGVRDTAIELARKYGADPDKAEIAALAHDLYRGIEKEELNKKVCELDLPLKYKNNANLAHGKIAAREIQTEYGISDDDIINAVSFHTTGRAGMSVLEKVVYLADAIEPNRDYPGVDRLRELAKKNLDEAVLASLNGTIEFVRKQGSFLDEDTIKARDYLERKEEKA